MSGFLRGLSPDQQVSLLFVLVFGLLLLASAAAVLASLWERQRDGDKTTDATHTRWQEARIHYGALLRASWLMSTLFWLAWAMGPAMATALFGVVSFLALREFISLTPTRRGDHRSLVLAFFVVLPAQYAFVWAGHDHLFTVFIPVYAFLALPVVSALAGDAQRFLERNAKLQWGVMVCVYGMSHVPALFLLEFPRLGGQASVFLVVSLLLSVQTCMVVQHAVSRRLKRPVTPQISASFHWGAWTAGLLAGALLGALMAGLTPFKPGQAFGLSLAACAAGSLGHLVMKAIKRDRGVASWGQSTVSVTGASGLLDKMDALCFAAPVFFHSVRWYFKL